MNTPQHPVPEHWTETKIARQLATQFFNKKYLVVVPNCNFTGYECDVLCITENLRIIDVEIKTSRADLKADAKKDKWWHRGVGRYNRETRKYDYDPDTKIEWPRKVWKHYYCLPASIWKDDLLETLPSTKSGILLIQPRLRGDGIEITCKRRATPDKNADKLKPEQVLNVSRLASLRMWDSYAKVDEYKRIINTHDINTTNKQENNQ